MLAADGLSGPLEPWDWRYYSEKRRRAEHDLDEALLKPYLSLDAMLGAMFDCATRLFGLEFREIPGPFYHPDVRGWEVTRKGEHVAVLPGYRPRDRWQNPLCSASSGHRSGVRSRASRASFGHSHHTSMKLIHIGGAQQSQGRAA